jgi:hypothetical protein
MVLHRYKKALAMFEYLPSRPYRVAALMAGCYARVGDIERAKACVAECLILNPTFSIGRFMTRHPFNNPTDEATLAESLRMAGLPE